MSSLFASLDLAKLSLQAQQLGLEITQKNISNVNTTGYSRQRLNLTPADPAGTDPALTLTGVSAASLESFRNRFMDHRLTQEMQSKGFYEFVSTALRQVEAIVNENGGLGLENALSEFFNSFSQLANAPEDVTLREEVLAQGVELGREFRRLYDQIQSVQTYQDYFVSDTVQEINSITATFADLNGRIVEAEALSSPELFELKDQRQLLLERVSELMDVAYFETETGAISLVTKQGAILVLEDQNRSLEAVRSTTGNLLEVHLDGADITSTIQGGKLGGVLQVRDVTIAGYLSALDDMAAALIERVNEQHALGVDLNGAAGGDFFVPFVPSAPGSTVGAARSVALAVTDAMAIAAAGAGGGPGNNANTRLIADIANETLLSGGTATLNQAYTALIFNVGNDMRGSEEALDAQSALLVQLQNQRDSFSGVNLDEEAVNLIRYQKAYQASARVITLLDGLTEEVVNLIGV
jgi:flagellar hook-associated protein 1 FlgK